MKYDVHIFAVVRVKVSNVKAVSYADALAKAEGKVDLYQLFDSKMQARHVSECGAAETEFADELSDRLAYLVDRVGDNTYRHSRRLDQNYIEIRAS